MQELHHYIFQKHGLIFKKPMILSEKYTEKKDIGYAGMLYHAKKM